ncbi:hypothetical protein C7S15_0377 [Burkholderia cepacia]|nr:hypothetical protein [Burkholderia cepacia]
MRGTPPSGAPGWRATAGQRGMTGRSPNRAVRHGTCVTDAVPGR